MVKKEIIIFVDYSQKKPLTLAELCEICRISKDKVNLLVDYEVIHPQGKTPEDWLFDLEQLKRIKIALRLQQDLEMNIAGTAVVLDLLDEVEELRNRLELLEKHFLFF